MKKTIIFAIAIISSTIAHATVKTNAPLTWGTEATYAPFESLDHKGNIVGFDSDLEQSICQVLNTKCEMQNAPFPSLIPSLNIGKYDAIIGGLAITSSRKKVISFSKSYYQDEVVLVSSSKTTPAKLNGKAIGVQAGTSFQQFLQQYYPKSNIKSYASNMNALADLKSHRVDAVLIDQPVYAAWLQKQATKTDFVTYPAAKTKQQKLSLGLLGNGIGIAKDNIKLLTKINHALNVLSKNGTLAKLKKKWFENV